MSDNTDVKSQIRELVLLINDSMYRAVIGGDRETLSSIYETSLDHLQIKLFELNLPKKHETIIKAGVNTLIKKHLSIFYNIHCLQHNPEEAVVDVLSLEEADLDKIMNYVLTGE